METGPEPSGGSGSDKGYGQGNSKFRWCLGTQDRFSIRLGVVRPRLIGSHRGACACVCKMPVRQAEIPGAEICALGIDRSDDTVLCIGFHLYTFRVQYLFRNRSRRWLRLSDGGLVRTPCGRAGYIVPDPRAHRGLGIFCKFPVLQVAFY